LRISENRVLRRIFGSKRQLESGRWTTIHEELHNLYSSLNTIRVIKSRWMRWTGQVACLGVTKKCIQILVRKQEAKRPFGRPKCRWEDDILMHFKEVGCKGVSWILDSSGSVEYQVVGSCQHGNEILGSIKGKEFD
jgi:hypothetical protein